MASLKLNFYMDADGNNLESRQEFFQFCRSLPADFKITKYGASELAREMSNFKGFEDAGLARFVNLEDVGYVSLRMPGYIINFFPKSAHAEASLSLRSSATSVDKKLIAIDNAWRIFFPDGKAFYYCYSGYAAHGALGYDQDDSEYVNRFSHSVKYPTYHAATGEYLYDSGQDMNALRYLDLLPGLTWRIAMGERHFEKYNISPEEISEVCVSTEETTAANGDKLWKFQSREDPLDWRDSYERQLKLDRPDVFFDIAPLRERFSEAADIKDSGRGKELEKIFKMALIELYPEAATKGIVV
ncbi:MULTISPECIES: hypothetical protein [Alphaproteobacteria]|uniref:hypothetical protein n=1 Tax=Alphaproteobacteria TaxID=28211 RepID=UPI0032985774